MSRPPWRRVLSCGINLSAVILWSCAVSSPISLWILQLFLIIYLLQMQYAFEWDTIEPLGHKGHHVVVKCLNSCWFARVCVCASQTGLQVFLLLVALLSVPVLLFGKPLYLYWLHKGRNRLGMYRGYEHVRHSSDEEISLMRTHDLEEGTSLDSHSNSSDSQSEEVNRHTPSSHWFVARRARWLALVPKMEKSQSIPIYAHDWHNPDLMVLWRHSS